MTDEKPATIAADELAFPDELRAQEEAYLEQRSATSQQRKRVGFALSGGGIRSATFCLGVFQALAARNSIREIDYLSTVSGGGYFGGFFTRLFERCGSAEIVETMLTNDANVSSEPGQIQRWLRENGRYLAPQGSGSMLYNVAIVTRNWFTLLAVVMIFGLTIFLAFEGLLDSLRLFEIGVPGNTGFHFAPGVPLIVSALIFFPLGALTFYYFPGAIAYWSFNSKSNWLTSVARALFVAVPAAAVSAVIWSVFSHQALVNDPVFLVSFMFAVQYFVALVMLARVRSEPDGIGRNRLSRTVKNALVTFLALLTIAAIHSVALNLAQQGMAFVAWVVGVVSAALTPFVLYAPKLAQVIQAAPTGSRFPVPKRILLGLLAILILGGLASAMGAVAHHLFSTSPGYGWFALLLALLTCGSLAFQSNFVNRCSLLPLYTARLVRAYLGASNKARYGGEEQDLLHTHRDDDLSDARYRKLYEVPGDASSGDPIRAPIHIINVTINETVSGRSQVQQQDRKGLGLAVGPFSYSAGAHNHLLRSSNKRFPVGDFYHVFDNGRTPEALSLGWWTGISGAAFNTGLGYRTSLGMSVVTGLLNIRLGYWWNSGQKDRGKGSWYRRLLQTIFPVQVKIFDEWTARFKGTVEPFWHLSDGGHFENMGGYELIRRKLPIIVIIDAEADPDYGFEGLANLTRKARLDFGAEISFFDHAELDSLFDLGDQRSIGTLDELRRGRWAPDKASDQQWLEEDKKGHSLVHAALARVSYQSGGDDSLLVYIKPTLTGREPSDLIEYHRNHPDFPHESTADQFFDEAQWESYRKLGQWIAEQIFDPSPGQPGAFRPAQWVARMSMPRGHHD